MPYEEEKSGDQGLPCFHCDPQKYIRTVQHLIEKCLVMRMSRDDTVRVLASRAGVRPVVTLTVWKELLKENRSFFHEYFREIAFKPPVYKPHPRVSGFPRRRQQTGALTDTQECRCHDQSKRDSSSS